MKREILELLKEVKRKVLEREKPRKEDYRRAREIFNFFKQRGEEAAVKEKVKVEIMEVGSIAKDTWLRTDKDMDIFLLFPEDYDIEVLREKGLKIAREMAKDLHYVEEYAEHPYIKIYYQDFTIDIVPCFKVKSPLRIKSATDRTPFHTEYIKGKLKEEMKDEVRILKKFMKGIGVYGAEIKVEGFSGYLCELLVVKYGTFEKVLEESLKWKPWRTVIDIEGYYKGNVERALKKFKAPLVVIDPVDPKRNVAAAVSLEKMLEFKTAAKLFLKKPSLKFFYPPKLKPASKIEFKHYLEKTKTAIVLVEVVLLHKLPGDVIWAQVKRSLKGLKGLLEREGFNVIYSYAWTNERNKCILLYELEPRELTPYYKFKGPPVGIENEEAFLSKYLNAKNIYGPWIENGRWYVLKKRERRKPKEIIQDKILTVKHGIHIRNSLAKGKYKIYVNEEILELMEREEIAKAIKKIINKKPIWLEGYNEPQDTRRQ